LAISDRQVATRSRGGLIIALGALTAFGILFGLVRANRSASVDVALTMKLQRRRWPWLARLMAIVSWPGFPPQSRLIPPLLPVLLLARGYRVEAVFQGLAWGTGLISAVVKWAMRRPRPDHPEVQVAIARIGGSSFPSGHVINYVGVYGFLAYLAHTWIRPAALRRTVVGLLVALIALVGPSRVYLGHHWPTDVLASYLLGGSYLIGLTSLYRRVRFPRCRQ
jgi:undecaprenyl-diphosphatase